MNLYIGKDIKWVRIGRRRWAEGIVIKLYQIIVLKITSKVLNPTEQIRASYLKKKTLKGIFYEFNFKSLFWNK